LVEKLLDLNQTQINVIEEMKVVQNRPYLEFKEGALKNYQALRSMLSELYEGEFSELDPNVQIETLSKDGEILYTLLNKLLEDFSDLDVIYNQEQHQILDRDEIELQPNKQFEIKKIALLMNET